MLARCPRTPDPFERGLNTIRTPADTILRTSHFAPNEEVGDARSNHHAPGIDRPPRGVTAAVGSGLVEHPTPAEEMRHQACPAGLVRRPQARTGVPVEVLVELE
jgi:hypothetical protein